MGQILDTQTDPLRQNEASASDALMIPQQPSVRATMWLLLSLVQGLDGGSYGL